MILALKQIYRSMEQNKQIDKKINQCIYGYSIYYIDTKNIQWRKDSLFNKQFWEKWTVMFKKKRTVTFKRMNWITILQHTQRLTQNRLRT